MQNDWRFRKDVILEYIDNEIDLYNISSLKIFSNYCNQPKAGMLNYRDLNKISFNNQPILIRNLKILTPASDTRALLDVQIKHATND